MVIVNLDSPRTTDCGFEAAANRARKKLTNA